MPPTDSDRPGGGQDFDDGFWDELADFLDEPPRRPDAPEPPRDDIPSPPEDAGDAAAAGERPPVGDEVTAGAEPGLPEPAVEDQSVAATDEPGHETDDSWWDGVWEDEAPVPDGDEGVSTGHQVSEQHASEEGDAVADAVPGETPAAESGDEDRVGAVPEGEAPTEGAEEPGTDDEAGSMLPAAGEGAAGSGAAGAKEEGFEPFRPADVPDAAPLPSPRRRMSAGTQRRIAAVVAAVLVVALVALVGPVRHAFSSAMHGLGEGTADLSGAAADRWRSWSTELQTIAADLPARQIDEQRQIEGSESLLFVVVDDDDRTVGIAMLALAPDGGSTLALLPPSLYEILPGYGDFPLAEATVFEGPDLTAVTVANVLGVRVDDVATLGPGDLAAAVGTPIDVDLPAALVVDEGGGSQRVVAQPGPGERSAEQVEALMVVRGTSDPLEWLQRQTAVWDGILAGVASDPGLASRLAGFAADSTAATGTLARAAAGDPEVTVVPVTRIAVAGADEGFKVSYDDADEFVARRMAHLALRSGDRPRVEVLNGNGRVLTTRSVAEALIRRGFRVIKTDNAENFEFEETLVIAQGREHRAEADEAIDALGAGELLLELRAPSGVVDVSIIVGRDIPAGEA